MVRAKRSVDLGWLRDVLRAVRAATEIAVPAGMRVPVATKAADFRRGADSLAAPAASGIRGYRAILVETNGLTSSLSFLLCHPNAEAAQLVIVDELDSGVFECRLNFDQS